jgi:hypothetical protein
VSEVISQMNKMGPAAPVAKKVTKAPPLLKPVPDWVVWTTEGIVYIFVTGLIVESYLFIWAYGTYLQPNAVWATIAATIIGVLVCFLIFESVKCVVLGCIAIVRDEDMKRQEEKRRREERRAGKQEFADQRRLTAEQRALARKKQMDPVRLSPPPPIMG